MDPAGDPASKGAVPASKSKGVAPSSSSMRRVAGASLRISANQWEQIYFEHLSTMSMHFQGSESQTAAAAPIAARRFGCQCWQLSVQVFCPWRSRELPLLRDAFGKYKIPSPKKYPRSHHVALDHIGSFISGSVMGRVGMVIIVIIVIKYRPEMLTWVPAVGRQKICSTAKQHGCTGELTVTLGRTSVR